MDAMKALKAEMERKRKLTSSLSEPVKAGGLKFMRQSDVLEAEEKNRQEKQAEYEQHQQKRTKTASSANYCAMTLQQVSDADAAVVVFETDPATSLNSSSCSNSGRSKSMELLKDKLNELNLNEIQARLRSFGQPVTMFGEATIDERRKRLLACYAGVVATDDADFDEIAVSTPASALHSPDGHGSSDDENEHEGAGRSTADVSGIPDDTKSPAVAFPNPNTKKQKWYLDRSVKYTLVARYSKEKVIYKYFKGLLKRWGYFLSLRSEQDKNSSKGRLESQGHNRCKEYLSEFFKMCLTKTVPADILSNIYAIVSACEDGDYITAHEWYIKTAIGNSAWPIGVTMVGIHERSGREKLTKVAHVMNNELSRKYLTSMKRLLSFAQSQADDVAPSRKVG